MFTMALIGLWWYIEQLNWILLFAQISVFFLALQPLPVTSLKPVRKLPGPRVGSCSCPLAGSGFLLLNIQLDKLTPNSSQFKSALDHLAHFMLDILCTCTHIHRVCVDLRRLIIPRKHLWLPLARVSDTFLLLKYTIITHRPVFSWSLTPAWCLGVDVSMHSPVSLARRCWSNLY